ncbi:NAD(P)H-hydrate dehydratase [Robiginitalea sp.]|uniref:NAD(P)H-hydrate dehydratase n=1 Tax=Robiginitalea sp. TaxID=1902411 RepID=UPI003C72F200
MKILDRSQIYEADAQTLNAQEISSTDLMERAATKAFDWLHHRLQGNPVNIHVFCGTGNNGGDGLVLARHLVEHGYHVAVYVVKYSERRSDDFLTNLKRLKARKMWPEYLDEGSPLPELHPDALIVDCVFGIGLNRPPQSWVGALFEHLNASGAFILSIDMPSGMYLDQLPEDLSKVVHANHILTFQAPKLVFFLPQTGAVIQQWEALDIGLDAAYLDSVIPEYELLDPTVLRSWYRPRSKFDHKGTFGHAFILGGSHGKIGAVALASRAALLCGTGLVTACVPGCGYIPLQTQLPEIMVHTTAAMEEHLELPEVLSGQTAGIGMGLGTGAGVQKAFLAWLKIQKQPVVLDADALNILSLNPKALKDIPEESILTPHPGELKRLIGAWKDDFDKLKKARAFAQKWKCILLIKGAHTMILRKEKGYINLTGNPGMATGGSGDVLSGMITGLRATGYPPLQAALLGVYLHGRAGDLSVGETGVEALTASDILSGIGMAFRELSGQLPSQPPQNDSTEPSENSSQEPAQNGSQSHSESSEKPS